MADPVADSLLEYRKLFPALEECVHFISHSLGCVPAQANEDLAEYLELWRTKSITAWSDWLPEVDRAAERIAKIISATPGTVIMQHNVSQVMATLASCFEYTPERNKVVYEALQFPTVSYVWQAEKRRGAECVLVESKDGTTIDTDAMCAAIDEKTLVVPISHVVFSSAYIQDVKKICARAKEVGAHVILDCYQSIGTVPLDVVDLGVSLRVRRIGEVRVRRAGRGVALRAQGSDRAVRAARHGLVRQRGAVRVHDARADLRREHVAVHGRHARDRGAVPVARGSEDHRRDRRPQDPREEPGDDADSASTGSTSSA